MALPFRSGRVFLFSLQVIGFAAGVAVLAADGLTALAGVTSSTAHRYYSVSGTSTASLASRMRANPFRGDRGGAVANIRPKYTLNVVTKKTGSTCTVATVNLNVRFTLTLPRAQESAMSSGTRSAWQSFVSFARRHEQQHRNIYLQCARNFVAKAQRLSGPSCGTLKSKAQRMLSAEERACDKRHAAFDRSERRRLSSQALFRTARR